MSDLIVVKQLPIIEEKLKEVSNKVKQEVEEAKSLVCTEETVKLVKEKRAKLNNTFKALEEERKQVKNKVLEPYNKFEDSYKQYVSDIFKNGDAALKQKIDSVEQELKTKKENEIKQYFEEYRTANNIDFITYEQARINVTLTASMKSLKEQVKNFIDRVTDDINLIETQEYKPEILVEYKQTLNVSNAITTVTNRFKAIEEEKARQEELKRKQLENQQKIVDENIRIQEKEIQKALNQFIPEENQGPLEQPKTEQEEILILNFKVKATKTKLKELKEFLDNGGYDYE